MRYVELFQEAEKNKNIEVVQPLFIKLEKEGETIIGAYVSAHEVLSNLSDGTYNMYVFDTDDGLVKFSLGGSADKDVGGLLRAGEVYCIKYLGKQDIGKGKRVNKYDIRRIVPQVKGAGGQNDIPFDEKGV